MSVRFAEPEIIDEGEEDEETVTRSFYDFGLDNRLLKAIADLQWPAPTPIQAETIPYALSGKDLLVKARTGSGKTGVYAIAAIQHLLSKQQTTTSNVRILILSPTKELCHQISSVFLKLTSYCRREINLYDLSNSLSTQIQKQSLISNSNSLPEIIISTPTKLLEHLKDSTSPLNLNTLELFILDEADILYSLGYANDMKKISKYLPSKSKSYQCFLISATLNDDLLQLKQLFLHNPVKINQSDDYSTILPDNKQLLQYYIYCEQDQKFVLVVTIFKLQLLVGRTILFVNSVEQAYRLKLLMEQFHIKTCLLNSELPMDSRLHIVQQYNDGLYDVMIATDAPNVVPIEEGEVEGEGEKTVVEEESKKKKKKKKEEVSRKGDKEYGVSRGIDFYRVANIINFDFPMDFDSYVHRVGRTARVDQKGLALSLISQKEMPYFENVRAELENEYGEDMFHLYRFKSEQVDGFRYRALDALRGITRISIREARLKEIKSEIFNSKKLKTYFNDNKKELQLLRHDSALHIVKVKDHLKHVPDYLVPNSLKKTSSTTTTTTSDQQSSTNYKRKSDTMHTNVKRMKRNNPLTNSLNAVTALKKEIARKKT
ncbi:unnamed protein product [Adineta steineri]|uniref:RNA helicase n=1 Tax=Adineta steineri TaxID=433720 RepID=A0A818I267_9BILA|nr:unnamed protein product [Adineta steineri]CAF1296030.1 unnamed protein product [Adineta steineri]CAF3517806.1 unnamed protein product [Adineta steineri]CAF3545747.1 unnamed protein product [Adineta steineri]